MSTHVRFERMQETDTSALLARPGPGQLRFILVANVTEDGKKRLQSVTIRTNSVPVNTLLNFYSSNMLMITPVIGNPTKVMLRLFVQSRDDWINSDLLTPVIGRYQVLEIQWYGIGRSYQSF